MRKFKRGVPANEMARSFGEGLDRQLQGGTEDAIEWIPGSRARYEGEMTDEKGTVIVPPRVRRRYPLVQEDDIIRRQSELPNMDLGADDERGIDDGIVRYPSETPQMNGSVRRGMARRDVQFGGGGGDPEDPNENPSYTPNSNGSPDAFYSELEQFQNVFDAADPAVKSATQKAQSGDIEGALHDLTRSANGFTDGGAEAIEEMSKRLGVRAPWETPGFSWDDKPAQPKTSGPPNDMMR